MLLEEVRFDILALLMGALTRFHVRVPLLAVPPVPVRKNAFGVPACRLRIGRARYSDYVSGTDKGTILMDDTL